jgi:titin
VKVTGLVKGTAYTFQVAAVNAAGTGVYSAKSSPAVVPRAVPGTPLNFMVSADDKQANLSWDAPANNGDAISDYVVKSCRGATCTEFVHEPSSNTTITVTGLSNGTAYTFKVAAKNAAGVGGEATSGGVTPRTVAGAPTGVAGTPGDRRVDLTWTAPVDSGGAAVSDYVVQYCTTTCTTFVDAVSSATSATVTGLTNGTTYTFQVAAVNAARTGGYSARSSEVTPRTVPGAPTSVTTEVNSSGGVIVSWTAPTDNGGAVITDYMVQSCISTTCTNFVRTPESALTTQTVTGLTKGTAYTFKVAAKNVAGFGAYSTASSPAVTPRSAPGAPTDIVAVPGNQKLDVTWKAPAVTNGSAITDYIINVCDTVARRTFTDQRIKAMRSPSGT